MFIVCCILITWYGSTHPIIINLDVTNLSKPTGHVMHRQFNI